MSSIALVLTIDAFDCELRHGGKRRVTAAMSANCLANNARSGARFLGRVRVETSRLDTYSAQIN
jgi:hypothetical protein